MKLPQFNLRDLFWLTLVVAMGLGWGLTAFSLRRFKTDRVDVYIDGYIEGQSNLSSWWAEKIESADDPAVKATLSEYWQEQSHGGRIDVPDELWR